VLGEIFNVLPDLISRTCGF